MICQDERIRNICAELFAFLKSDKTEAVIHEKKVKKTVKPTVIQAELTVGFLTVRMVWKPFSKVNGVPSGSDEGANVFIYLPFTENRNGTGEQFQLSGYWSERGTEKILSALVNSEYKTTPIGVRRVVSDAPVTTTDPLL
jgi:hypothetical protein